MLLFLSCLGISKSCYRSGAISTEPTPSAQASLARFCRVSEFQILTIRSQKIKRPKAKIGSSCSTETNTVLGWRLVYRSRQSPLYLRNSRPSVNLNFEYAQNAKHQTGGAFLFLTKRPSHQAPIGNGASPEFVVERGQTAKRLFSAN